MFPDGEVVPLEKASGTVGFELGHCTMRLGCHRLPLTTKLPVDGDLPEDESEGQGKSGDECVSELHRLAGARTDARFLRRGDFIHAIVPFVVGLYCGLWHELFDAGERIPDASDEIHLEERLGFLHEADPFK